MIKQDLKSILCELDGMTCASSREFEAGYKIAVQDAKERIIYWFNQLQ